MSVQDRIDFAQKYIKNKEGANWSLCGREWVRDQFWIPADGFKLWRDPKKNPCKDCLAMIGNFVEHPNDNPTKDCDCGGLIAEPIVVTALNLQRQDGKTFNTCAFALSQLYRARNKSIALLCANEEQAEALLRENYTNAIRSNKKLERLAVIRRMRIEIPSRNNVIEALSTSHRAVTGRSRTHLLIDEARDIEARVVMALFPAIFAMSGVECPLGHVQLDQSQTEKAPETCSACGQRLVPWWGRIIITSSSGVIDDSERGWFAEMIDQLEREPQPNWHIFRSLDSVNPKKSKKIISAIEDVMGRLPSAKNYIEAEVGNRWTRKGEEVVSRSDAKKCADTTLGDYTSCDSPGFALLDTSITVEKTSIVVLLSDTEKLVEGEDLWTRLFVPRIDYWDPTKSATGTIDEKEVAKRACEVIMMFSGIKKFFVDVRGSPWSVRLYDSLKKKGGRIGGVVWKWRHEKENTYRGWQIFEQRILEKTIRFPDYDVIYKELGGIVRKPRPDGGPPRIVDRSREKMHADITESIALLCFHVGIQQIGLSRGASMADIVSRLKPSIKGKAYKTKKIGGQSFGKDWY